MQLSLADDLLLHVAGMPSGLELPVRNGALRELKGRDNRRYRAAISQQGQHDSP